MTHFFLVMALARVLAGETPGCPVEAKVAAAHVWHNRTEAGIAGGWFGDAEPTALDWYIALTWMHHEDPTDGSLWFIHPDDRKRMAWLQGPAAVRTGYWKCNGTEVESWNLEAMILSDTELSEWAANRGVLPYEPGLVNPASVDLRWSGRFRVGSLFGWQDVRETASLFVMPGWTYLLDTLETVSLPSSLAGLMTLKSSTGRMGLLLSHAGWVDPGFVGTLSMVLSNGTKWPVKIDQGQKLAQIAVMRMSTEPARDYRLTGRYVGQSEPTPAKDAL